MSKLWKSVWVLGTTVMGLALSAPVLAVTSGVGPYYATPSWDQTLPVATRFIVLTNMNSAAVLDRETGLVWEQSPSTSTFPWSSTSGATTAAQHCNQLPVGNRKGWRLPSLQELASLIDPSIAVPGPTLPAGHPFTNVQNLTFESMYWSATSTAFNFPPLLAWLVSFYNGLVESGNSKTNTNYVWCVRGGSGVDTQ